MKLIEDLDTFQPIVPTTLSQEIRYHVFALSLLPPIGGLGVESISPSKLKFHHDWEPENKFKLGIQSKFAL